MRTRARKTAYQIALRNCSKEVGGKVSTYVILVKLGKEVWHMQSSTQSCRRLLQVTRSRRHHEGF